MSHRDKYFKGQQDNEELICFFRHHWIYLARYIAYAFAILVLGVISLNYFQEIQEIIRGNQAMRMFFLTGFAAYTFSIHHTFLKFLNYFVNIGIVTNLRIIDHKKSLYFRDTIDAIDLNQIQNIEQIENGVFPNLLGYGDLKIYLNASNAVLTFRSLPNIKFHFRCISRQKEARQSDLSKVLS